MNTSSRKSAKQKQLGTPFRPPSPWTKKVLVVGGAGCIGWAIAKQYLNHEYEVIVADVNKEAGDKIMRETTGNLSFIHVDVLDAHSICRFSETLQTRFTEITHLVSLAGGAFPEEHTQFESCPVDTISRSIDLNLKSHLQLVREVLPLLGKTRGIDSTITLISSVNALKSFGLPAYSAAKAGLLGLVVSLADELGSKGIRINTVLPGTVPTPRTLKLPKDFKRLTNLTVLGRLTTPEEVASVVFCLTNYMTCVTGQAIVADCGQTVKAVSATGPARQHSG
jgi:NAD(P)-dependent dehydrogenase (short-subunit alcohol dehydrogenase family)